jgi:hypothetical protein
MKTLLIQELSAELEFANAQMIAAKTVARTALASLLTGYSVS